MHLAALRASTFRLQEFHGSTGGEEEQGESTV